MYSDAGKSCCLQRNPAILGAYLEAPQEGPGPPFCLLPHSLGMEGAFVDPGWDGDAERGHWEVGEEGAMCLAWVEQQRWGGKMRAWAARAQGLCMEGTEQC